MLKGRAGLTHYTYAPLPRTSSALLAFGVVIYSGWDVGQTTLFLLFGLLMLGIGDLVLAVRWWLLANYMPRVEAARKAAAARQQKTTVPGSAKKKR